MVEWSWDLYAGQLLGVLASAATVWLFLALLAFQWHRMEALRACREVHKGILARYDEVKRQRSEKRREREKLVGTVTPGKMAAAVRKMMQ